MIADRFAATILRRILASPSCTSLPLYTTKWITSRYRNHQVRAPSLPNAKSRLEKADNLCNHSSTIQGEKRQRSITEALG